MITAHRSSLGEAASRAATCNGRLNPRYAAAIEDWAMRWHDGDPAWVHARFGFNPDDYGVDLIPRKTAVEFVARHHYSRSVPALRKYRFGLFCLAGDRPGLCGVALLSIPPRKEVLTKAFPGLEAYHESAELGRLVLLDQVPHGAEGFSFGEIRRWLARNSPIRGLVMFSDPEPRRRNDNTILLPGHVGTTYQSANSACLGKSAARRITLVDGLVFSARTRSKILNLEQGWRGATAQLVSAGADPFDAAHDDPREWLPRALRQARARYLDHGGCWKYALPIGCTARQRGRVTIAGPRCDYPKLSLGQLTLF
jgi:hypothetical protein